MLNLYYFSQNKCKTQKAQFSHRCGVFWHNWKIFPDDGKTFNVRDIAVLKKRIIRCSTWRFLFAWSSFIKWLTSVPACFGYGHRLLQRSKPQLEVTISLFCSCVECISAHYPVGCNVLQAPHCLTWWSYITAASQQVRGVWSNTSLNLQHLSKLTLVW